jgi:SPP1 family phage portal protein
MTEGFMPLDITNDFLKVAYQNLMAKNRLVHENAAYVKGENPPIYNENPKEKPDNRIPTPFAKIAVEDMSGYAARPGDIKLEFEKIIDASGADEENKEDEYIKINALISEYNDDGIEIAELYQEALTQGCSWELWWVSDNLNLPGGMLTPEYKILSNSEVFPIWSNDLKPKLEALLRFYKIDGDLYADVYYPFYAERFVRYKNKDNFIKVSFVNEAGNESETFVYPYSQVPAICYPINKDKTSLFQAEKPIIDSHDKLISKSLNEVDRFNALIALFPDKVDQQFVEKLIEYKMIDDLGTWDGDKWPRYLEKNLNNIQQFYENLTDRYERLFHKSIKVPDLSNLNISGNSQESGRARAFKFLMMEIKASQIDIYFNQGLRKRKDLLDDVFKASTLKFDLDDYTVNINNKRNLPVDKQIAIEIALGLQGLGLSKETVLKSLPGGIIDSVENELKRIKKEQPESISFIEEDENE